MELHSKQDLPIKDAINKLFESTTSDRISQLETAAGHLDNALSVIKDAIKGTEGEFYATKHIVDQLQKLLGVAPYDYTYTIAKLITDIENDVTLDG